MDTTPAELKESFNEMISMIPEDLVIDEKLKKEFLTQHKRFEEIISDIVISEIRQDYDTSKIFLNNWIVKIRDGNLETINYDARLHYMDNEYITRNSLYNSLYKLHKNEPVDADFIEIGTMAYPTTNDGTDVYVKGILPCQMAEMIPGDNHSGGAENITPSSQNSFGEEFMPESYYHKEQSELIIEYLVFLSEVLTFKNWNQVANERKKASKKRSEGLMLKHKNSAYAVGRKKGYWWKWKSDPKTIDAVLTYARRGHGKRTNLYTDYTFALWHEKSLVTFAKAYSGLTDIEMKKVDQFYKELKSIYDVDIEFVDERLTTFEAREILKDERHDNVDAHAAKILIDSWFENSDKE